MTAAENFEPVDTLRSVDVVEKEVQAVKAQVLATERMFVLYIINLPVNRLPAH